MALLDSFGRPVRAPARINPRTMQGVSGTVAFGGHIKSDETNPNLMGLRRYKTYSEMLANTAIVAASVRLFLNLIGRSDWTVSPVDDKPEATRYAELAEEMIIADPATPFRRIVRRSAGFVFYGFSIQEWAVKKSEKGPYLTYADVAPRPQRTISRWATDETGEIYGAWQTSPHTGRELFLPRGKIVYLVDDSLNDSPEGLGLFRHIVDSADRLKEFHSLEAMGYQTDLAGIPIGRAPMSELQALVDSAQITEGQRDAALETLRVFLRNPVRTPDKSLILDSATFKTEDETGAPSNVPLWDMQTLDVKVGNQEAMFQAIERINREIARVFGAEQLLLGGDGAGSFALSEQKAVQLYLIVEAALAEIGDTYNRDLLDPIWALNGLPDEWKPELIPQAPSFHEVSEMTAALRDLATAGATLLPNDPVVRDIYERFGLPFEERSPEDMDAMLGGGEPPGDEPEFDDAEGEGDDE